MLKNKTLSNLNQAPGYKPNAPELKKGGTNPGKRNGSVTPFSYKHPAPDLKTGSTEKARTYKKNTSNSATTGGAFGKFIGN